MKQLNIAFSISTPELERIKGNRPTYDTRKLEHAMIIGEYIPPILVDKATKIIIDGQNRYEAACNLWRQEIPYELQIVMADFQNPLLSAIKFNNTSKRWTSANYVEAWIADGRNSYMILKDFVKQCPLLAYKTAIELIYGKNSSTVIPRGTLQLTWKDCDKARILYNELVAMSTAVDCEMFFETGVISSWGKVRNTILSNTAWDKWLKTFKRHFTAPGSRKQEYWVVEFNRINSKIRQHI